MVNAASGYDAKIQKTLEECKITQKLMNYIENFNYPYVNDVQTYYEQLLKIGQGTFGEVFKARCKRTGNLVALKKILMENEKEGFPITALREIKMLKMLRHKNITELIEVCTSKQKNNRERFSFYLVFTFCEHDLAGLLSQNQGKIKFSLVHIKTMAKHILLGLEKIHRSNILHRDMKSANVLITADGVLKLADFGLARLMIKQPDYRYTNRVVTLWYRPPELLLGTSNYGPSIDIWGAGCIITELWVRIPILQGNTEQEQLIKITQLCGSINPESWPGCEKLPLYGKLIPSSSGDFTQSALQQSFPRRVHEKISPYLEKWAKTNNVDGLDDFTQFLAFTTQQKEQAMSLIDQMLSLCPEQRPTAEHALDHTFFWSQPMPADNIKDLVERLQGQNLFEYTSGCGAHANRKQRPIAPAAPVHNAASNNQQQQQRKAPTQTQSRHPVNSGQQQQHFKQEPNKPNTMGAQSISGQQQQFGQAQASSSTSNVNNNPRQGRVMNANAHQQQQQPFGIKNPIHDNAAQASRKRLVPMSGHDDLANQPPAIRRPTPLAQTPAGRQVPNRAPNAESAWNHPQQHHAPYPNQREIQNGSGNTGWPPVHQQHFPHSSSGNRPAQLMATTVPRHWGISPQQQQGQFMPRIPPMHQMQMGRYMAPGQHPNPNQPSYNRQPPPDQSQFFNSNRY